jgi:2-(1,2-epoxy-1,2-dihydrophenyl)acetyl-CoA isomerase
VPEAPLDEQVRHRLDGGVAWITLNRPEAGNALTPDARNRVIDLLEAAGGDLATRAVVLTATGNKAFCTGADLRARRDEAAKPEGAPERPVGTVARMIRTGAQRLVAAVQDCEKPVVAAVNGTAAGLGAHLALACDLVLAAEGARFIEVFVRRGITPDGGGAYLLSRLIGLHKAKELVFFGDDCPAEEAERIGLVNHVVAADELEAAVDKMARKLAAGPQIAIRFNKRLVNKELEEKVNKIYDLALALEAITFETADHREAVRAFLDKRKPVFGRHRDDASGEPSGGSADR